MQIVHDPTSTVTCAFAMTIASKGSTLLFHTFDVTRQGEPPTLAQLIHRLEFETECCSRGPSVLPELVELRRGEFEASTA
jgi:hypothetical protein